MNWLGQGILGNGFKLWEMRKELRNILLALLAKILKSSWFDLMDDPQNEPNSEPFMKAVSIENELNARNFCDFLIRTFNKVSASLLTKLEKVDSVDNQKVVILKALSIILQEFHYDHQLVDGKSKPMILRRLAASFREEANNLKLIFLFVLNLGSKLAQQVITLQQSNYQLHKT